MNASNAHFKWTFFIQCLCNQLLTSSLPAEQLEILGSSWNGISNVFPTLFPVCAYGSGGFLIRLILLEHEEQNYIHSFTVGLHLQTKATILSFFPLSSCPFALSPAQTSLAMCRCGQTNALADHGQNCPWIMLLPWLISVQCQEVSLANPDSSWAGWKKPLRINVCCQNSVLYT